MTAQCTNEECTEYQIEKDTAELEAFYGFPGFECICGECGRLCAWPEGTPPPPDPEPEDE